MVHEKAPSTKETAIQEDWNHFDKEYCFKFVKSIPVRIEAVIKVQGGGN